MLTPLLATAQHFKSIKSLDSLVQVSKEQNDSIWSIRYDNLAEKSENILIISFQDSLMCVSITPAVNYQVQFHNRFTTCLSQYKSDATLLVTNYSKSLLSGTDTRDLIQMIEIVTPTRYHFRELNEEHQQFINALMKLAILDYEHQNRIVRPEDKSKKNKNKKRN